MNFFFAYFDVLAKDWAARAHTHTNIWVVIILTSLLHVLRSAVNSLPNNSAYGSESAHKLKAQNELKCNANVVNDDDLSECSALHFSPFCQSVFCLWIVAVSHAAKNERKIQNSVNNFVILANLHRRRISAASTRTSISHLFLFAASKEPFFCCLLNTFIFSDVIVALSKIKDQ